MIKKIMVGLLCAMVGVSFATDFNYKKESNWNQTDLAKIEKCLAAATAAKDKTFIIKCEVLKLIANKDATNTSYAELKKLCASASPDQVCSLILNCKRFNSFTKNVINDPELNNCKYYNTFFPTYTFVYKQLGYNEWRKTFINLKTLNKVTSPESGSKILKRYNEGSESLNAAEIKSDCAIFKRAWYPNISKSEEWKKLLVKIELMLKSVE